MSLPRFVGIIATLVFLLFVTVSSGGILLPAYQIVAPPEPAITPAIPVLKDSDKDHDGIEDALGDKVARFEKERATPATAATAVDETVVVEFMFSSQITQPLLDTFVRLGGQVTHVYQSVSYGWNGTLPLSKVRASVQAAGPTLFIISEAKPIRWHLDKATRAGRVRPQVWDIGYVGNTTITIAIMDTGVDDTHMDLTGRTEYWKDYTSDNSSTPISVVSHGTHVAGIALGTGAASGVNPTILHWTDQGSFPSAGYFYPANHSLSTAVTQFDWSLNMVWQTGRNASAQLGMLTVNAGTFGYALLASQVTSTSSPISTGLTGISNPLAGYLSLYSSFSSANNPQAAGKAYSTANTVTARVSNFGVGDSYNLFRGVAPGCRWAGAKVFTNAGTGNSTDIGAALDDMVTQRVAHNIKVLNMSIGLSGAGVQDATLRAKTNTCVDNGIVVCVSAGNDGPTGEMSDPARAGEVITVGAANEINQLTDYTSIWTNAGPGSTQDFKPDVLAPGGSLLSRYSATMSVDSNDGDAEGALPDQVGNDYQIMSGTSMASPFAAGCAALVIDAWQTAGHSWSFGSSADPLFVKMLLCASATETNQARESGSNNPTLERASANAFTGTNKDRYEGYGMINPDAAIGALTTPFVSPLTASLGPTPNGARAVGRYVDLTTGAPLALNLTGMTGGDYDLYLYDSVPGAKGNPVILASSTNAGTNVSEAIMFTPATAGRAYILVKRVTGSGPFTLSAGCSAPAVPTNAQANPAAICMGACSTLSATAGAGGDTVEWFTGSCGGTPVSGGVSPSVCPTTATTYYVRTKNTSTGCTSTCVTVTLAVNPGVPEDLDHDCDADLTDFGFFQACFNGPNQSPASGCTVNADFDGDSDVDLADFGRFQACFNGPNRPPASGCVP